MSWRSSIEKQHRARVEAGRWRLRQIIESPQGAQVNVAGKRYHNFCSNDYLGLANAPRLIEAAIDAAEKFGVGSGASHLICGHHSQHQELEEKLASFVGAEKAVVFSTGYMANLAIAQAFLGRDDFVFQDKLNHASLIDAGRYCDAKLKRYAHADLSEAKKLFQACDRGRKMIMTDGVFSMDGDVAPIQNLKQLVDEQDALLVVDEAHGFGVLGAGQGAAAEAGISPSENLMIMGTFGKAAGSFGAFVAGDTLFAEQLIQFGRTYVYTTALPPHVVAITSAAIDILKNDVELRDRLFANVDHFKKLIATEENESAGGIARRFLRSSTPIQPMLIGSADIAMKASNFLKQKGFLVSAIRPPTVPTNSSRLRFTFTSAHDFSAIDDLVQTIFSDEFQRILDSSSVEFEASK